MTASTEPGAGSRLCGPELLRQAAHILARQILGWQEGAGPAADGEGASPGAGEDLYGGVPGLALFWAAMARCDPGERPAHAARSLRALAPTRRLLETWLAEAAGEPPRIRLGGMYGLGGMIYVLTCAGVWLGEPALLDEAAAAAALVFPGLVARDRRFDVVDGSAGALLGLLALAETSRSLGRSPEAPLAAARLCARHLLEGFGTGPQGMDAWETGEGKTFCGFAHGASGILYSLLRFHAWEREPALPEVARRAMVFERRLYRPGLGSWAPFPGFDGKPMAAWCWGAPGILLSRIAALEALGPLEAEEDVRDALRATLAQPQTLEDHLCCGNLGRALILVHAARRLGGTGLCDPEALLGAADRLVHGVLRRAKGRGGFGWSARPREESFQPFFLKGGAGAGYAFLQLAGPGILPLPLLLEAPAPG